MRQMSMWVVLSVTSCVALAQGTERVVPMDLIDGAGTVRSIGTITISESKYGLVFTPKLEGLPLGVHGFHVHQNGSCQAGVKDGQLVAGLAAGGHYDPLDARHHGLPWGDGHLGDLPGLVVTKEGESVYPVLGPRLTLDDVKSRSLMLHMGGDNHADHPQPLGGGGGRMACGVVGG